MPDLRTPSKKLLIGVCHLPPLPGAPGMTASAMAGVLERVRADAAALVAGGADAVIVENFGDAPFYGERVPAETVAGLTLAVSAVAAICRDAELSVGVNVLRNDARAALGICAATGADLLRVNVHTGTMATDQGVLTGRAAETLRERARLCPEVLVCADVHVKHARPLTDESIEEAAADTWHRGRADVLIVSGTGTGSEPAAEELARVRERLPEAPLWIGSGLTSENAERLLAWADGAIVGTALKRDGRVQNEIDPERVRALRVAMDRL